MAEAVNIFWFRRDLRLDDNAGLHYALRSGLPVIPIFIFDRNILDRLEDKKDRRVEFIYDSIIDMQRQLQEIGSTLQVYYDIPENVFAKLVKERKIEKVFTNMDYEPYATERDDKIKKILGEQHTAFEAYKDQVIFDRNEIMKDDGTPYTIFTPYSRRWKAALNAFQLKSYPVKKYWTNFYRQQYLPIPSLGDMGFIAQHIPFPSSEINNSLVKKYANQRDYPAENNTSRLGIHLRFGTISIRELVAKTKELSEVFVNELIWRDFYHMILWHFPQVGKGASFKPAYDMVQWRNNEDEFKKWCEGKTGYPIVDAGMRQLNESGFMHNRVRMITASFLAKHLLIDWRWGEAYFAAKLLDYDLAANNGGWQWAAGSGCDAAPYFRVFNPTLQTKRFDPDLKYIRHWVPEFEELTYPQPIVEHSFARERALAAYAAALKSN